MDDLRELIRSAFDAARLRRKPSWHRMSAAVLKNRMIQLSGRTFREPDYGASSFMDLLRGLSDVVRVDESTQPPTIELLGADAKSDEVPHAPRGRVRGDLWRAAIDYQSGNRYVWDIVAQQARVATASDAGPYIPAITPDTASAWRASFLDEHRPLVPADDLANVEAWVKNGVGRLLPVRLQHLWFAKLKTEVLSRLKAWFTEQNIEPPVEMLIEAPQRDEQPQQPDSEALRRVVLDCVRAMTYAELAELRLPPTALARARRRS